MWIRIIFIQNSNTTLVKVKLIKILWVALLHFYSNTTLVKVKLSSAKLVIKAPLYSNTTLVKVKLRALFIQENLEQIQIQLLLKLNWCGYSSGFK